MKLLSWNIQQGGGTRIPRIVESVVTHDPDVIMLGEFRTRPGVALCVALVSRGWRYVESTSPIGSDNGLCVLSRTPMERARLCPAPPENHARWLDVYFPAHKLGVGVLHILCLVPKLSDGLKDEAKVRFWNAVLGAAQSRLGEPFLFIGDFNTGVHLMDEVGRTFACSEHFAKLSTLGWTDMWRHYNRGKTEWTWYSKRKGGVQGNGFRLDHAFAAPSLVPRIASCRYSHKEREGRISDHSILIVEVD
jgi:exonuclease III